MTTEEKVWKVTQQSPFTVFDPDGKVAFQGQAPKDAMVALAFSIQNTRKLTRACELAYPILQAYCNAMGETCPEDAAEALGALKDLLEPKPENWIPTGAKAEEQHGEPKP